MSKTLSLTAHILREMAMATNSNDKASPKTSFCASDEQNSIDVDKGLACGAYAVSPCTASYANRLGLEKEQNLFDQFAWKERV